MLIFAAGYGVAREGIFNPNATDIGFIDKVQTVLRIPYWQIYGELFLDELQCGPDSSTGEPCVTGHEVVVIMTAAYLLIANILLLNMLIAIFNNIFTEYQENAEEIWKFERHRLVTEYQKRPVLVPPFMTFAHLWRLCKWTNRKKRKIVPKIFKKNEKEEVADDDEELLDRWEEDMIKSYVNKETVQKEHSVENMIGELSERMLTISVRLNEVDRRLQQLDEIDSKLDSQIRGINDDDNSIDDKIRALDIKFNTLLDASSKQSSKLADVQWTMLKLKKSLGSRTVRVRKKSTSVASTSPAVASLSSTTSQSPKDNV
ncbi:transient receptor potential cation channel subfamily M member 3-like [Antedon mediterranea]|uniref:transient receptor potential cation channel subfamily M member 3-like n=1 Tax=Antedon mediterranea TaxID=105859 RepID=UPI003AF75C59